MIRHGDALEIMRTLDAGAFALVVADPPYFRVADEDWDRQWPDEAAYLAWLGECCDEWRRLLKPNGSLYCFCSPAMAWAVEGVIRERFDVLNNILWRKQGMTLHRNDPAMARQFWPASERIIFAEQRGGESRGFVFEPLRAYLDGERRRAEVSKSDCNIACGFAAGNSMASRHYFSRFQWCLPTAEHYTKLQALFNRGNGSGYLARDFEELRQEYESLRRPFALTSHRNATDCWEFRSAKARPDRHSCEKPLAMAEHIVATSSRDGNRVLDPFCGSGVFGVACARLGRDYLGIDADEGHCETARRRIRSHQPVLPLDYDGRSTKASEERKR